MLHRALCPSKMACKCESERERECPKTISNDHRSHKCFVLITTSVQRHVPSAIRKHLGSTRSAVEVKILHTQTKVNSSIEMAQRRRHTEVLFFFSHINEHCKKFKNTPPLTASLLQHISLPFFSNISFSKHPLIKKIVVSLCS